MPEKKGSYRAQCLSVIRPLVFREAGGSRDRQSIPSRLFCISCFMILPFPFLPFPYEGLLPYPVLPVQPFLLLPSGG